MKNGIIKISVFTALDTIAKNHQVRDQEWAKAAWDDPRYQSRISELRKKANTKETIAGRAFSYQKCVALLDGLKNLIGENTVAKEIGLLLKEARTARERILLMVMAMAEKDEKQVEMFLRAVIV